MSSDRGLCKSSKGEYAGYYAVGKCQGYGDELNSNYFEGEASGGSYNSIILIAERKKDL